jgi:hypothetical protein
LSLRFKRSYLCICERCHVINVARGRRFPKKILSSGLATLCCASKPLWYQLMVI